MAYADRWSAHLPEGRFQQAVRQKPVMIDKPAAARKYRKYATAEVTDQIRSTFEAHPEVLSSPVETAVIAATLMLHGEDSAAETGDELAAAEALLQEMISHVVETGPMTLLEPFWEVSALLADTDPLAARIRARTDPLLQSLPTVVNAAWARDIGVTVPTDRPWDLRWAIPLGRTNPDAKPWNDLSSPEFGLAAALVWEPGKGRLPGQTRDPEKIDRTFTLWCARHWYIDGAGDFTTPDSRYDTRCFGASDDSGFPAEHAISALPDSIYDAPRILAEMIELVGEQPAWEEFEVRASKGIKGHRKAIIEWLRSGSAAR